jgi:phage terminase large subunit GpA-like protein
VRGYHINGLYAPIGLGLSWPEMVADWIDTKGDITKLKRFINTALGEVWEDDRTKDLTPHSLLDRAEPYALREVPPGCLVITAGVDTQDDRLAVQLVGWGADNRRWILDWLELPGSPGRGKVWDDLTEYLSQPLTNSAGRTLHIEATAIDSGGHYTHEVYQYVRLRRIRRPLAIKGRSTPGSAILASRPSAVDVNTRGRVIRDGAKLWMVGTDSAKHAIYNALISDTDQPPENRLVHFSGDLALEYYQQLIAETFDPEKNKWLLRKGRRNEALDTAVYAMAASQHPEIRVHAKRPADWQRLAEQLESDKSNPPPAAARPVPAPNLERKTTQPGAVPRRSMGFRDRWKR